MHMIWALGHAVEAKLVDAMKCAGIYENSGVKFIKAGTLDDSSWVSITSNFWGSSAQAWSPADEESHTFTHNPDLG